MPCRAYFTDGYTAERHTVRVVLDSHDLWIIDEHDVVRDVWTLSGLQLADSPYRGQPTRVVHQGRPAACLTFADPCSLARLIAVVPRLNRRRTVRRSTVTSLMAWGVAVVVTVTVMGIGVPRLAGPLARLVPLQWEKSLGRQVTAVFLQHTSVCRNAAGEAALRTLTDQLVRTLPTPIPVTVQVYRFPTVNAFALPGGEIVVSQGLVESAQAPEEVAGVLAHEMAHQVQRHPMQGILRSIGFHLISSTVVGGFSLASFYGANFGGTLLALSYGREDELEADRMAITILNRANIRGDGLITFFSRHQGANQNQSSNAVNTENRLLTFLSTHPPGQERIANIRAAMRGKGNALTAKQWHDLQTICGTERPQRW